MEDTNIIKKTSRLENAGLYIILGMVFILPIFFIPSLSIPFQFTKTAIILFGVLISFILLMSSVLKSGKMILPRGLILISAWSIALIYFLSALFSGNIQMSFSGQVFGTDTFSFVILMVLLMSLVPLLFRTKKSIFRVYIFLLFSFALLSIFQFLRLIFGTDFMEFGLFTNITSNPFGKWNDLSIFFGLTAVLSLITLSGLSANKSLKVVLYSTLIVSLFFLAVINFFSVWLVVGLFALGSFIYSLSKRRSSIENEISISEDENSNKYGRQNRNKTLFPSIIVLAIAVVFIIGGNPIGNYIASAFDILHIEARPSWQSTTNIVGQTYDEHILLGSGPNTFTKQWLLMKPQEINNTLFWNVDFASGIGFVPTSFATTGLLGGIAWVAFFIFLLFAGFKALTTSLIEDKFAYYLTLSSFLGSLYLWIFSVIYIPSHTLLFFAFLMTGLFLASLRLQSSKSKMFSEKEISFANNPRIGFISVLVLVILIIVSVVALYMVGTRYISSIYFQRSIVLLNTGGNIDDAEQKIGKAISLFNSDNYHRVAAEIGLIRLNQVISQGNDSNNQDEIRAQFQSALASAIRSAQAAVEIDKKNYQNWTTLGRVYGAVVPLGIEGAYENSNKSYQNALEFNPNNPITYLELARLELARNDVEKAKEYIGRSLEKKNNYTEAIFLLSQIEIQAGNIENAIRSVEAAVIIEPNNSVFLFQLGLLKYSTENNTEAISALERAIALSPSYSNARYFLGLSYYKTGRADEAIQQFDVISELNPNNEEVRLIIANLKAGRDPFVETSSSADISEVGTSLPIEGE